MGNARAVPRRAFRRPEPSVAASGPIRPKIIFVNRFFWPDESATSQILSDLAVHLSEEGFEVVVIASRQCLGGPNSLPPRGYLKEIEIRRVWSASLGGRTMWGKLIQFLSFYPSAFLELLRTLSRGDVVVAKTDPPLVSLVTLVAAKLRCANQINWLQDLYPEVAVELGTPGLTGPAGRILRALRNAALKAARMNVVIGDRMADRLVAAGVHRAKVKVISNWSDADEIEPIAPHRSALRQAWGLERDTFVLGYSGNLGRAHEADTLVEAATRLAHRPDIKFAMIGGGHEYSRLQSRVAELGLGNFLFEPHQPRERLQETLGAVDAHWISLRPELEGLIVPSKFYGVLAAGRPVVAIMSQDGEVARAIIHNRCGYVVEPGQAEELAERIERLANDPALRLALGNRARCASEQIFSMDRALGQWSELLARLGTRTISNSNGQGMTFVKAEQQSQLDAARR